MPDGSYELHSAANNSVMTASANKQAMISLAADKDGADQQFTFVKNSDGSFRIASTANKDLVMDTNRRAVQRICCGHRTARFVRIL